MSTPPFITAAHASRSRVAARQNLEGLRNSPEYRLGQAVQDWLRRPWDVARLGRIWSLWQPLPGERRYQFWALQIPPDPDDRREADETSLADARRLWEEWLAGESEWFCGVGRLLADWRRGPRRAWFRAYSRWRARDLPPVAPVRLPPALPREADPPAVPGLAPDWLMPWLRHSGVGPPELPGRLLVCLDESPCQAVPPGRAYVCWVLGARMLPEWEPLLAHAERVAAADAGLARSLGCLHLPPAIQPRLHNPFGRWNEELHPRQPDHPWGPLVRAARGLALEPDQASAWELPSDADPERERFRRMRHVLQSATLDARLQTLGLRPPVRPGLASVFCSTARPGQLRYTLRQFAAQVYAPKELILMLHGPGFDPDRVRRCCAKLGIVAHVRSVPGRVSLGECLQRAVCLASGHFLFKWDDDDWYGPRYLDEAVMALQTSEAGVVSKSTFPVRFQSHPTLCLLRPGGEFRYGVFGAGGTIGGWRKVFSQIPFRARRLNEDHGFFLDCLSGSIPIATTSRFGFVCRRGPVTGHTWRIGDRELQKDGLTLPPWQRTLDFDV